MTEPFFFNILGNLHYVKICRISFVSRKTRASREMARINCRREQLLTNRTIYNKVCYLNNIIFLAQHSIQIYLTFWCVNCILLYEFYGFRTSIFLHCQRGKIHSLNIRAVESSNS